MGIVIGTVLAALGTLVGSFLIGRYLCFPELFGNAPSAVSFLGRLINPPSLRWLTIQFLSSIAGIISGTALIIL